MKLRIVSESAAALAGHLEAVLVQQGLLKTDLVQVAPLRAARRTKSAAPVASNLVDVQASSAVEER